MRKSERDLVEEKGEWMRKSHIAKFFKKIRKPVQLFYTKLSLKYKS